MATISVTETFACAPGAFLALLADPAVALTRATATADLDGELLALSSTPGADGPRELRSAIGFTMPASWLGGLAGSPRLIRTESWLRDGPGYRGDIELTADGLPVTCAGTSAVEPTPDGSTVRLDLTLAVDVPVVGPMIEEKVAERIRDIMARELSVLREAAAAA